MSYGNFVELVPDVVMNIDNISYFKKDNVYGFSGSKKFVLYVFFKTNCYETDPGICKNYICLNFEQEKVRDEEYSRLKKCLIMEIDYDD